MSLTTKERELVAVGASLAASCETCTDYHFKKVRRAGASDEELEQAMIDAIAVRDNAKKIMERHGFKLLGLKRHGRTEDTEDAAGETNRMRELVFRGATAMDTIVQHVKERPVPPSQRTELEIPAPFEDVILRCLEKDPDKRPQSSDQLWELLRACEVNSAWTHEHARDWWDTHAPSGTAGQPALRQHR
jgi:AhpD family alkylhydroperoxidase